MDIPEELKNAIEELLSKNKKNEIIENAQIISNRYRNNDGKGKKLLTEQNEAISYAISRMPATYAAVYSAVSQTIDNYDENLQTLFDIGAGTGAAAWAVNDLVEITDVKCFECEKNMIKIGKKLMSNTELNKVKWEQFDILQDDITEKADIVVTSYMINELPENEKEFVIEKLWKVDRKSVV